MKYNPIEKIQLRRLATISGMLIVIIAVISITYAKYSLNSKNDNLYVAENFYFESEVMTDGNEIKSYTMQGGVDSIVVTLKNNVDDYRFSEVDIDYSVKITDLAGNDVYDKSGEKVLPKTGLLEKGKISHNDVIFENLPNNTYIVIAKSIEPYEKEIRANFVILQQDTSIQYSVKDAINSPVLQLTIATKDYDGNLKITWPSGTTPDNTDELFTDNNSKYNGGSKVISFGNNSERTIQLFKNDSARRYTESDFSVERSN